MTRKLNISAVTKLVEQFPGFDELTNARKAAFRARVSRYINTATNDTATLGILKIMQEKVGTAEPKKSAMTVTGLLSEFKTSWETMKPGQRAAFKAKSARLRGKLEKRLDQPGVNKINKMLSDIAELEKVAEKARLMQMAKAAGLID